MVRNTTFWAGWVALCWWLQPRPVAAAEPEEPTGAYQLGEIVVYGKRREVQATQRVAAVTSEDIRSAGARTLDQALNLLPGVNVRVGGEGIPRIDVRGFRTRHVLLLLNGIPINSAFDQQFDPTVIPTESIAEIKLTEGTSSVLYGQGGLGGVINIITQKGTSGLHGAISAESGDHESYLARGSISGGVGTLDCFVSASTTKVEAFPLSRGFQLTAEQATGYRTNSDKQRTNALGNVGFSPSEELTLGLTFSYAGGHFGKPGSAVRDTLLDPFASPPRYVRVDGFQNASAQLAADWKPSGSFGLRGWAFVNRLDEQDNRYDDATFSSFKQAGTFRERVRSTVAGTSLQPSYDLGRAGILTARLSLERNLWKSSGSSTAGPDVPVAPLDRAHGLDILSAALQYELSPLPGLGLVAGYGHHWRSGAAKSGDDCSALAAAHYDVLQGTRLKASFGRNIRFPSLGDLYGAEQGNPDLVAERATTVQAGVEQKLPWKTVASLDGFYTQARSLIQTDQSTGRSINLAEIRFAGLEITAATRPLEALLVRAAYTLLHSDDRSREGRQEQQYTPGDKATLEAKYEFAFGLSPFVSVLFLGDQFYYTKNSYTPVLKGKLADFVLVDVKLSQTLLDRKVTLYLGASNLLDRDYETSYGFPQPGRFVYGGVELRL
jgi:outer membrane cobalamin receptor